MPIPLLSVTHVNVNCTDLAVSQAFYRDLLGLEESVRTSPAPQDGAVFGLGGPVQWDATILHDPRGFAGPAVDLLEWKQPRPVGRPAARLDRPGFVSLGFGVPDLTAAFDRARARGVRVLAEPAEVSVEAGLSARIFHAFDPDGTLLELVEQPVSHAQLGHVTIACRDLERSVAWYARTLGLACFGGVEVEGVPGAPFGLEGDVAYAQRYLRVPGRGEFGLDLIEWRRPAPAPTEEKVANGLGIYRMAFLVEDVRACVTGLREAGVACPDPVFLDMGPTVPVEGVWAVLFPDPEGACLELIQAPV